MWECEEQDGWPSAIEYDHRAEEDSAALGATLGRQEKRH